MPTSPGFQSGAKTPPGAASCAASASGRIVEGTGGVPREYAEVRVLPTGIVEVPIGSQSQGQGHETVFAQVVAERLGVPFETVRIVRATPIGWRTASARSPRARWSGAAARPSRLRIWSSPPVHAMAAQLLEAAAADIEYRDGAFTVVGTDRSIGIFDVARAAAAGTLPAALGTALAAATMHENRAFAFANGCEVCELEVDPETGAVTIVAWTVVDDSGRSVNPMIVHGQMHGAAAQGIGQALTERCVYDPSSGQLLSGSFLDYAIPRADDLPAISVTSRDVPSPTNPLGVKGAGEGAHRRRAGRRHPRPPGCARAARRDAHRYAGHPRAGVAGDPECAPTRPARSGESLGQ